MGTGTRLSQLLSITKSIPLPDLRQGGSLFIRSTPKVPLNVRILPQWRDDAHLKLEQTLPPKQTCSDGNGITYSDMDEEMELRILNESTSKRQGSSKISVIVDYKKRSLPSLPSSETLSMVPFFGLTNKHEEKSNSDDFQRFITDDGSIHTAPSSSNLTLMQDDSKTEKTGREMQYNDGITHCTHYFPHNIDRPPPSMTLTAKIPENCNVSCTLDGAGGDIDITGKLEGEDGFQFSTSGNITLTKLRGNTISLTSASISDDSKKMGGCGGIIHVKKALEAQDLNIQVGQGGRIRSKLINISNANIEVTDTCLPTVEALDNDDGGALIDISSLYASESGNGANLCVLLPDLPFEQHKYQNNSTKVRVKSNHGHLSVRTHTFVHASHYPMVSAGKNDPLISLGGVNGSFDVMMKSKMIPIHSKLQHDAKSMERNKSPVVAEVHIGSLSPRQISILTSDFGGANLTFDQKVESDVRLLSCPFINELDETIIIGENEEEILSAVKEHLKNILPDHSKEDCISLISQSGDFINVEQYFVQNTVEYLRGFIQNRSENHFDTKTSEGSIGKIRIQGAADQALGAFSGGKSQIDQNAGFDDETTTNPLIVIAMDGSIKVESLSWLDAIARKHGVAGKAEHSDLPQ